MNIDHDTTPAPPLTNSRARYARAWEMVQIQPTGNRRYAHTADQIAGACGISRRTVDTMREFVDLLDAILNVARTGAQGQATQSLAEIAGMGSSVSGCWAYGPAT